MRKLLLLNGPNLNRLGKREPEVYGKTSLAEVESRLQQVAQDIGYELECKQSNHEGDLIDWIHNAEDEGIEGIIVNPGAFTHYSYALRDAVASVKTPVIEVHISNVHKREPFRHHSVIAEVSVGQIVGLDLYGYELALMGLIHFIKGVDHV